MLNKKHAKEKRFFAVFGIISLIFFIYMFEVSNESEIRNKEIEKFTFLQTNRLDDVNDISEIKLEGHFNKDIPKNASILMYSHQIHVEIKKNGKEIYSSRKEKLVTKVSHSIGIQWLDFASDGISKQDNIEIILENEYDNTNQQAYEIFLNNLYFGDKHDLLQQQLYNNKGQIFIAALILIFGIAFLITTIVFKFMKIDILNGYFACGMLLICGSLDSLIDYDYITLIFNNSFMINIIDCFLQMLICEFLLMYLRTFMLTLCTYRIVTTCIHSWMMCLLGYFILQSAGIKDITELARSLLIIACVLIIVTLICLLEEYRKHNDLGTKLLLQSGIFLGITAAIEIINVYLNYVYLIVVFELGLCAFTIVQFFIIMNYAKKSILKAEQVKKLEKEVVEMRIDIMLSQIQPHFIFNALLAIKQLCVTVPEKAADAINHFALFLRNNLDSINTKECVDFNIELNHIKNYLYLEKLRYEERLNIVYDIKIEDFKVPPLTIQPIVENAVRYGIKRKKQGGTITISTYEEDKDIIIQIKDDGDGFDTDKQFDDKRNHVGIENVRSRLENQCEGHLYINSIKNIGTTVKIAIPKKIEL